MKYKYQIWKGAFVALFVFVASIASAQDDCYVQENKKAAKLYGQATNKKKYKKVKRMEFLNQALEIDPDYAQANYLFGVEYIRTANYKGSNFGPALKYLEKADAGCPGYHSDVYYYMGEIYLGQKKYTLATKYLKLFVDFTSDDDKKFARDYEKKLAIAEDDYLYAKFYSEKMENPVPFKPSRLKTVSSESDEYLPFIAPDNRKILFTRKQEKTSKVVDSVFEEDEKQYEEKFSFSKNMGDEFELGQPYEAPFNQFVNANYGGATMSIDNRHIYLTICKPGKMGYMNCDIYTSNYVYGINPLADGDDKSWYWTEIENLGPEVNTPDGWESQPSLSADGRTLYFASARADSKAIDIYTSTKGPDGKWMPAVNVGEPINTEYNDKSPFIHSDSQTLYYSSQGHFGFGGYDVFYTRMDSGKWQQPENIGYPINTSEDEHGFVVSTDGRLVYFASDALDPIMGTGLDLFTFELYKEARPEKVMLLSGHVNDEKGTAVKDARIEIKNMKTKEVSTIKVDSMDGSYATIVKLEKGEDLVVNYKAEDSAPQTKLIDVDKLIEQEEKREAEVSHLNEEVDSTDEDPYAGAANREVELESVVAVETGDVKVDKIKVGGTYNLHDIHYHTSSADLYEKSKYVIDELALFLKEHPQMKVSIHGHTDNKGSEATNISLSTDRAYTVMAYLQQTHDIHNHRLTFKGHGSSKPVASNDTEEGREQNRRTEFVIEAL